MNDSVLNRFTPRAAVPVPANDATAEVELAGCFGFLRGVKERAMMLEARLKDGRIIALSYALLDRASFDPSDGITLRFTSQEVRIVGQRLSQSTETGPSLFDAIVRHRATFIREASRTEVLQSGRSGVIVETIEFR